MATPKDWGDFFLNDLTLQSALRPGATGKMRMSKAAEGRGMTLDRLIAEAGVLAGGAHPCTVLGHKWEFSGGMNCGCEIGYCSVPVLKCASCGDCDYGDNAEADQCRTECARARNDV
jgi:hypothetical protein